MEEFQTMITDMFGPYGPLMIVGLLGVFLILMTLPILLKREVDPLDKLKAGNTAEKYSNFLEPQNAEEYSAAKLKLLQAGYRSKNAVRIFNFLQFALGIFGLICGGVYTIIQSTQVDVTGQQLAMWIMGPGGVGYMLPRYWVTRRQQKRKEAITNGFPDSLDMMLVCVEAGQSLDQSILRVARELRGGFPDLSDEYDIVSQEVKAGKDKTTVLKDMSERCGVTDIASFVTVLVQSQQFGTSISDALRVYASEMRDKRVMRAEEQANKLPTKMTLATMMLTVPPLMAMLIGPSIYAIVKNLGTG
jgi:tight adherence protein C